jgi:hypothetical protein
MPTPTQAGTLTKFSIANNATTTRTITGVAAGASLVLFIGPDRFATGYTGELLTVTCPTAAFERVGHEASFSNNAGGNIRQECSIYLATNVAPGSHTVTIQAANIGGNTNPTVGSWLLSEFPGIVSVAPASALAAPAVAGRIPAGAPLITVGPTGNLSQAQAMIVAFFVARLNFYWNSADPGIPPTGHTLLAQDSDNTVSTPAIASWQDVNSTSPVSVSMAVVGSATSNGDGTRGVAVPLRLASGANYVEVLCTPDSEDGVVINGTTGWIANVAVGDPKDGYVVYSGIAAQATGNEIRVPGAGGTVAVGGTVNVQVVNAGLNYTSGWGVGTVRAGT